MSKTARTYIKHVTKFPMILVYPKFATPDVYMKNGVAAGKPAYKTDAKDDPANPGAIAAAQAVVLAELVKLFPDMDPKTRRITLKNGDTRTVYWPFKTDKDGVTTLTAKSGRISKETGELQRVLLVGADNAKLPDGVYPGGGTVAKLSLTLNEMPNAGGINFYINAVQVLKLEESSFGTSDFEPTEGYVYAPEATTAPADDFAGADEADATKF
jgi:hypothetical protein